MRTETNTRLVSRNRKIAQYLFVASIGVLVLSFIFANRQFSSSTTGNSTIGALLSALSVPLAFVTTIASVRMTNTWVREPRPEAALRDGLKGLSNKSVLYNYHHNPANHLLITPQGVFAIVTRFQNRRYSVQADRWQSHRNTLTKPIGFLQQDNVGNPTRDALKAASHAQNLLKEIAPNIEVQPLVVFIDPRVDLNITDPTVPVLHVSTKNKPNLTTFIREHNKQLAPELGRDKANTLTAEQIRKFEEVTISS